MRVRRLPLPAMPGGSDGAAGSTAGRLRGLVAMFMCTKFIISPFDGMPAAKFLTP